MYSSAFYKGMADQVEYNGSYHIARSDETGEDLLRSKEFILQLLDGGESIREVDVKRMVCLVVC